MKHKNLRLIGLTGGIATGKSTVSDILVEKGFKLIDADKIARDVVEKGKDAYFEVVNYFGESILLKNKEIDRKALGNLIFNDKDLRKTLNSIVHPYIFKEIKMQIEDISKENSLIFLDIPLLFEEYKLWKEYSIEFDEVWLVYSDKSTQINRLINRDKISEIEAIKRIESQMPMEKKMEMATKIIYNNKDIKYLKRQVEELLKTI